MNYVVYREALQFTTVDADCIEDAIQQAQEDDTVWKDHSSRITSAELFNGL